MKIWEIESEDAVRMIIDWSIRQINGATMVEAQNAEARSEEIRGRRFLVLWLGALRTAGLELAFWSWEWESATYSLRRE